MLGFVDVIVITIFKLWTKRDLHIDLDLPDPSDRMFALRTGVVPDPVFQYPETVSFDQDGFTRGAKGAFSVLARHITHINILKPLLISDINCPFQGFNRCRRLVRQQVSRIKAAYMPGD